MRILIHDFAGYPYPIQLSRELARRGHDVCHVYCASIATTPTGQITRLPSDSDRLAIRPVRLDQPLQKYSFVKRWAQENQVGRLVADEIRSFHPDVVVSANSPLDAHRHIIKESGRQRIPFVFWVQDLIGVAAEKLLSRKLPVAGKLIGAYYRRLEQKQIREAALAILLTADFLPILREADIPDDQLVVIENWAPVDELPVGDRRNAWSEQHGYSDKLTFVYAGTLGLKHNPAMLSGLARALETIDKARVVVLAEGPGAEWLRNEAKLGGLQNLDVRSFEPFERMPDVLASADVLVALLEKDAGVFSVPSKILAYLCAAKPLLLSIPVENLAARIVAASGAGIVVEPDDLQAFTAGAQRLAADADLRSSMGRSARAYAEENFPIAGIADRFEQQLQRLIPTQRK